MTDEVLSFDRAVTEAFKYGRLHVTMIQQIQVLTDHHRNRKLRIDTTGGFPGVLGDEKAFPIVNRVVSDVLEAKANFEFDY